MNMPFKQAFGATALPVVTVSAAAIAAVIGYVVYTGGQDAADVVQPDTPSIERPVETAPKLDAVPVAAPNPEPAAISAELAQTPLEPETSDRADVVQKAPANLEDQAQAEPQKQTMQAVDETVENELVTETIAPAAEAPDMPTADQSTLKTVVPSIDIVRIPPEGISTLAGHADANADILIFVDGIEVARSKANGGGEFVVLFDIPPVDHPRELQMASQIDGTRVFAAQSIVIAPFVAASKPEPTQDTVDLAELNASAPQDAVSQVGSSQADPDPIVEMKPDISTSEAPALTQETAQKLAQKIEPKQAEPKATPEKPAAPTVMTADDTGVKILQSAEQVQGVRIDAITYDPQGAVFASGRGRAGSTVRLYLNNAALTDAPVGPDGQWRVRLDVAAGLYALRADMLDAAGKVLSRVEIPFKREDVAVLARLAAGATEQAVTEPSGDVAASDVVEKAAVDATVEVPENAVQASAPRARIASVTVQPGNTLWGIASDTYGEGHLYARVFNANIIQIKDPDLIYPGQVFVLPQD
jgi:nucleoid-associated protein YgaU